MSNSMQFWRGFPKGDIVILMKDPNFNASSDETLLDFGDRNDNGKRFANFCSFYRLGIGGHFPRVADELIALDSYCVEKSRGVWSSQKDPERS